MQVGFAVLIRDGQVEIQFHGGRPGGPRSLVSHARHGALHAVLLGRLAYRSELADRLPPEMAPLDPDHDAALALAAYRHRGEEGLARLEGSYAVVIWDGEGRRVLGGRDPFGGYPLFWARLPDGLAIGTCQRPLLQHLPRRSLSQDYLAEFLALPGAMFSEPATRHAAYEGIHRVSPGSVVHAAASGADFAEYSRWNWSDRVADPGTERLEELGEMVGEGLRRAVRERLRGRVASHLSGGMDSTSVALLARDASGGRPVHAVSLVFERLGGLSRETPYLEDALRGPGFVPHRVPGDDLVDYAAFADPPVHDEPFGSLGRFGLLAKLAEAAVAAGADTLLTGYAAEAVVDQRPHHLADLIRCGRVLSAWEDASAWGRADSKSAWSYLWRYGLSPLMPAWRGRREPGDLPDWIRPEFAKAHAVGVPRTQPPRDLPANLAVILSRLPSSHGDCVSWYAAAPHGLAVAHPFLDTRFAALCLGIQSRFRQQPGTQKPLLAAAMRDVLPASILNRRSKGHYNALVHSGLARHLSALEDLVRSTAADTADVFDAGVLLRCLRQAALGFIPGRRMDKLDLTLAWLRWYSLQNKWQRPVTPAATVRVRVGERSPGAVTTA